jgi:NAD(P)-dependent dehydrogenase (short-subunit alcohol dehydrogenase family)
MVRPRVLITGANRGLGLEFARQYAADGWSVIATARQPEAANELRALGGDVTILPFDASDDQSVAQLIAAVDGVPLDIVIPNAGVGSGSEKLASQVTREEWMERVAINTFVPVKLALALRSNLERGTHKKLAGISSLAASIARYEISGHYAYRASKAALNAIWRSFSVEWRALGVTCVLLRPGKVRTRMTGFTGDLSAAESVAGMRQVIAASTLADSGRFLSYDGSEVDW